MGYLPIEDHGIIGNMRTAALVGVDGSIDWFCAPRFDSPSIFGALLDQNGGGCFKIAPTAEGFSHKQYYWPDTNVLITHFSSAEGAVEITDFMPMGEAKERERREAKPRFLGSNRPRVDRTPSRSTREPVGPLLALVPLLYLLKALLGLIFCLVGSTQVLSRLLGDNFMPFLHLLDHGSSCQDDAV